jgi:hypothetical protein
VAGDLVDPRRQEPAYILGERAMLEAWLEFQRTTLLLKCEGLDDAAHKLRPIPTSLLSLHGLVRHLTEVERNWFRRTMAGEADVPPVFGAPHGGDDFGNVDDADWEHDLRAWEAECAAARAVASTLELDDIGIRRGNECSLRWVYVHMIEEYARHNGHADLIRELVDGAVGW